MEKVTKLKDLLSSALGADFGVADIEISGLNYDSRQVKKGEIFCCFVDDQFDGHDFAKSAIEHGAICLIVEREISNDVLHYDIPQVLVEDSRKALALLACEFWGNPSRKLTTVGVTGTNGKTTVTQIISHIACTRAIAIGTLSGDLTTPPAPELQAQLSEAHLNGIELVALEVSSHSIEQHRVDGIDFDLTVFLNLGLDHLDYHPDMESYFEAKASLFTPQFSSQALINTDTEWGCKLLDRVPSAVGFSAQNIEVLNTSPAGSKFIWDEKECFINLPGRINVANAVAALESLKLLGYDMEIAIKKLETLPKVPGRFELIQNTPFLVVVDYAHTPDALSATLESTREIIDTSARILLVFGCGGERDKSKRPEMGKVAESLADKVFLTSDNSRGEKTQSIVEEICSGIESRGKNEKIEIELDRKKAIDSAIQLADTGDMVLIAGKGHEAHQILKSGTLDFDDREVVKEILKSKK